MTTKSVEAQISAILDEFVATEKEKIERITKEVAKDTAQQLRQTSPRSNKAGKHYADGWRVRNENAGAVRRSIMSIVYNATKPHLTQLLARSHDIKNQFGGPYGRSKPDPHLDNAEKDGNERYLRRLEEEL
jgi:hypothetical protein